MIVNTHEGELWGVVCDLEVWLSYVFAIVLLYVIVDHCVWKEYGHFMAVNTLCPEQNDHFAGDILKQIVDKWTQYLVLDYAVQEKVRNITVMS